MYVLVSNHLILIFFVLYFLLGMGEGVCSKDLKMLHTLVWVWGLFSVLFCWVFFFFQMTDRT